MQQRIETGRIVTTHGVRGEVKIEPWSDSPETLVKLKTLYLADGTAMAVERCRAAGAMVICKFKGYDDMDQANRLRGKVVFLDRSDIKLAPGQYFICDLVGLKVVDADTAEEYGTLCEVSPTGANDVYHIRRPDGRETLIPAIPLVVISTDIENGVMTIRPLEGLMDDAD